MMMARFVAEIVGWIVIAIFAGYAIFGWIGLGRMAIECLGGGCPS